MRHTRHLLFTGIALAGAVAIAATAAALPQPKRARSEVAKAAAPVPEKPAPSKAAGDTMPDVKMPAPTEPPKPEPKPEPKPAAQKPVAKPVPTTAKAVAATVQKTPEMTKETAPKPVEPLRLECKSGEFDGQRGVGCMWSASAHPDFAGYRLWRVSDAERAVIFRTEDREATRHLDTTVDASKGYGYAVEAVNAAGQTIARSDKVWVGPAAPKVQDLALGCRAVADDTQRGVGCMWSASEHPNAREYRLYRSVDGGPKVLVHQAAVGEPTRFFDSDVSPGHAYLYAVLAVTGDEQVVGKGGPVKVAFPAE